MSSPGSFEVFFQTLANSTIRNPVEPYFASAWNYMTDNFSRPVISIVFSVILREVVYFGLCAPGFIYQFLPYMQRFKVQQDKPETYELQWKCFKLLMYNHFFIQMPLISMSYFLEPMGVAYEYDKIPPWYVLLFKVFLCMVIEDTWQYFTHRLLHHRSLYKRVHKIHHHFQAPFAMAAEYTHPIETVVLWIGSFIGILLLCNHLITIWLWMIVRVLETVDVHSGYDFPYLNPLHLIPGYAGARFHDFHHMNFNGNYASTFLWWDWLLGTDKQYKEYVKSQQSLKKKVE